MNISSIVVVPHPSSIEQVRSALSALAGVEVVAMSPEGRIVATLETADDRSTSALYDSIGQADGVLSVAMVFHQSEEHPDDELKLVA